MDNRAKLVTGVATAVVLMCLAVWAVSIKGQLTVTFSPAPLPPITYGLGACSANGQVGVPYSCKVTIQGGAPPYKMVTDPTAPWPAGFVIAPDPSGAFVISGTYNGAANVPVAFPFIVCDSTQSSCP